MGNLGRTRRGFTLVEAGVVSVVAAVIGMQVAPAVRHARSSARGTGSASNLMQIGQGAGMYAQDNGGRIFTFTLPGLRQLPSGAYATNTYELPDGSTVRTYDDLDSADVQETELIQRRTGRVSGEFHFLYGSGNRMPHRRRIGLVLLDYLGRDLDDTLFVDPADASQLQWVASSLDYGDTSTVPYAQGLQPGYDSDGNWPTEQVRQRWAFSSSYLTTTSAWQGDGLVNEGIYVPVETTPHLLNAYGPGGGGQPRVFLSQGRNYGDVRFPSAKVYFFEEHDREQAGEPYFAYDHATPEKLMFDGSVNGWASGDARPSWNPRNGKAEWRQTYVPLDRFPIPLGGLGDQTLLSQRYRWTLGGLQGLDYVRRLMPGR